MQKISTFFISLLFSTISAPFLCLKEVDIFKAVECKNLQMIKHFVEMGVPLNSLNKNGKTVLDIATERNYNKICRYLLRSGAKVTSQEKAIVLRQNLQRRGILMTVLGGLSGLFYLGSWILGGGLIAGGVMAFKDRSLIQIL